MRHDAASEKLFAEAPAAKAAKIGVIASPFLAAAWPNSNKLINPTYKSSAIKTDGFY
jgi:hypothetical protein